MCLNAPMPIMKADSEWYRRLFCVRWQTFMESAWTTSLGAPIIKSFTNSLIATWTTPCRCFPALPYTQQSFLDALGISAG